MKNTRSVLTRKSDQPRPDGDPLQISAIAALAEDEDDWCRHESDLDAAKHLHEWIRHRAGIRSTSGNPLADDEDAWARP